MKGFRVLFGAVLGAAVTAASAAPARPGDIRVLHGVSFYEGDPGPIGAGKAPGAREPDMRLVIGPSGAALYFNTLYGEHEGAANCVVRHRVVFDDWDRDHPYVRVCRNPG
ncbi:hypothetical protein SAMN06265338_101645 [Rhodoblastus acidophilus]|uniref:Uncharacterized protein n=1 Tax=Rhodoblastus acidophilus TaxID=1074 RepID=A0A212QJV5_RHOAC|nr:hypothetical protein [Rhodoblastus acidophilus]PPQ39945.1 hypothetical protein CKO16_03845 [Rhodoblastus acidophilus]RAI23281.1 hypothetical protein CH337_03350 [Rhodoblastus acidophilus]SNB59636.1 hypothetical protein SAMN06265338_101645 [Rhodoblastus acidophilus]